MRAKPRREPISPTHRAAPRPATAGRRGRSAAGAPWWTLSLAAALLATACGSQATVEPAGSPTVAAATPTETTTPIAEYPIAGRVTFYGARAGDTAAGIIAGDFNGDGSQDVVLSAALADGPDDARPDGGEAYLFLGPFAPGEERNAARGQQDLTVYGATAGDQLARTMAAGDLNGDGADDLALNAPFGDGPGEARPDAGETYILFGSPGLGRDVTEVDLANQPADAVIYGENSQDLAGFALLAADVSGDGRHDLIMGAFWADGPADSRQDAGEVYVLFGSEALTGTRDLAQGPPNVVVYGARAGDWLGEEVGAGDVNGDGVLDLVLAAPFAPGRQGAEAAGQTFVIVGPPPARVDIAAGEQQLTIYGVDAGDQLGHSLGTGDVNGDGLWDILLAAVSSDGQENGVRLAGEAALVLGRPLPAGPGGSVVDVAAGGAAALIYGGSAGDRLGRSATVGDLNGDGLADLLVVAPGGDGPRERLPNAGEVNVIEGAPSLPSLLPLGQPGPQRLITGLDPEDILGSEVFGRPVVLLRDINGDGFGDLLIGAPRGDGPGIRTTDAGEAYILFSAGLR